jgi:hypothetical protein
VNLDNYVDVATRRKIAADLWPDLRIIEAEPKVVTIGSDTFIAVTVTVYRNPDDELPTSATAWEAYPGKSSFTRGSEMMNASTSALGRALGFMGIGIGKSISTSDEIAPRQAERDKPAEAPRRLSEPRKAADGTGGAKPPRLATQPQIAKLNVLLMELGHVTRTTKLAKVVAVVGRPLESSTDMTVDEARQVIEVLDVEVTNKRAADDLAQLAATIEEPTNG